MMMKTHLALGAAVALYFLPHVKDKVIFFPVVILATLLPDLSNLNFWRKGKPRTLKKIPLFDYLFKTYTFCIGVTVLLALFYPLLALPFFLGYSFHLITDAFTPEGIQPFWPLGKRSTGRVKTGGTIDTTLFIVFVIVAFALFIKLFL
jgi:membrane-bound metal-dependent hydrolase YbcI (DUF457 family)